MPAAVAATSAAAAVAAVVVKVARQQQRDLGPARGQVIQQPHQVVGQPGRAVVGVGHHPLRLGQAEDHPLVRLHLLAAEEPQLGLVEVAVQLGVDAEQPGPMGQLQGEVAARLRRHPAADARAPAEHLHEALQTVVPVVVAGHRQQVGRVLGHRPARRRWQRQLVGIDQPAQVAVVVWALDRPDRRRESAAAPGAGSTASHPVRRRRWSATARPGPGDRIGGIEAVAHVGDVVDPQRALGDPAAPGSRAPARRPRPASCSRKSARPPKMSARIVWRAVCSSCKGSYQPTMLRQPGRRLRRRGRHRGCAHCRAPRHSGQE